MLKLVQNADALLSEDTPTLTLDKHTPALDLETIPCLASALLADPDFVEGFACGIESYEADVEDRGAMLATRTMCKAIAYDLSPHFLANEKAFDNAMGFKRTPSAFVAGYHAGWVAVHVARLYGLTLPLDLKKEVHHA